MLRHVLLPSLCCLAHSTAVVTFPRRGILSDSVIGKRLLSSARYLADGDNAAEQDFSWMSGYSLKFEHCVKNANCDDDGCTSLVHFSLCPADSSCASGCSGGAEYLVDMYYFLDAFTEAQLGAKEYACEMAREACGDEDGCYERYGLDYCEEEQQGNFNLQKYLSCNQFGDDGGDPYYLAPYCSSDGYSIYLGIFTDDSCNTRAGDDTFDSVYGYELDYSASSEYSIVADECAYCKDHSQEEQKDGEDQADKDDVLEQCGELYTTASGCEENFDVDNPDLDACDYINEIKNNFAQTEHSTSGRGLVRNLAIVAFVVCAAILGFWWCLEKKKASKAPLLEVGMA